MNSDPFRILICTLQKRTQHEFAATKEDQCYIRISIFWINIVSYKKLRCYVTFNLVFFCKKGRYVTASFCETLLCDESFYDRAFLDGFFYFILRSGHWNLFAKMAAAAQADPAEPRGHALPGHRRD
jgi:hypothetical protein